MGSDIVLSKLDAAPSPGQIARPIIYDGSTSDAPSQATHHNHSDTLIGLSIPLAQQRFFASFASQNERTDALTNVAVRQFSLSFKYPLSHALNLFIAKTRADNINSAGYATQSAVVPKSVQLGIRYDF